MLLRMKYTTQLTHTSRLSRQVSDPHYAVDSRGHSKFMFREVLDFPGIC